MDCFADIGNDTLPLLNECESKCLNYKLQSIRGDFDFTGKRVAFFRGNLGQVRMSKIWYFECLKKMHVINGYIDPEYNKTLVFFFNEDDAIQIGLDAVIFSGCKKTPLTKKDVIKRIKKNQVSIDNNK